MLTEQIKAFRETRFGWLGPDGTLVPCPMFDHISALSTAPELAEAVTRYKEEVASNEEAMYETLSMLGPDDHPEMHRFEGMNDDARAKLTRAAYEAGWIRLGLMYDQQAVPRDRTRVRDFMQNPVFMLEAEGYDQPIDTQMRLIEDLAAILEARVEARQMGFVTVKMTKRTNQTMFLEKKTRDDLAKQGKVV